MDHMYEVLSRSPFHIELKRGWPVLPENIVAGGDYIFTSEVRKDWKEDFCKYDSEVIHYNAVHVDGDLIGSEIRRSIKKLLESGSKSMALPESLAEALMALSKSCEPEYGRLDYWINDSEGITRRANRIYVASKKKPAKRKRKVYSHLKMADAMLRYLSDATDFNFNKPVLFCWEIRGSKSRWAASQEVLFAKKLTNWKRMEEALRKNDVTDENIAVAKEAWKNPTLADGHWR